MFVAHPAPSPSGKVLHASAPVIEPTAHSTAIASKPRPSTCPRSHPNPRRIQRLRRVSSEVPYGAQRRSNRPKSLRPGRLVLAHLARTRSCVFARLLRSRGQSISVSVGAHAHQSGPFTGVLSMPSFKAHRLRGAVPSSSAPANTTGASAAGPCPRTHSRAVAASTRPANPACSGLAALRAARR